MTHKEPALLVVIAGLLGLGHAGFWEKKLLEDLEIATYYNSLERPVHNESNSVPLQIHLEYKRRSLKMIYLHRTNLFSLQQIIDLDEKNQILTTNIWLTLNWHDTYMKWKPEDYGGITVN